MALHDNLKATLASVDIPLPLDADRADAGHMDMREEAYWLERPYMDTAFADSDLEKGGAVEAAATPSRLADMAAHPAHARRRALAPPGADYPDHTHTWARKIWHSLSRIAARGL